jgi:hypothetical protein
MNTDKTASEVFRAVTFWSAAAWRRFGPWPDTAQFHEQPSTN